MFEGRVLLRECNMAINVSIRPRDHQTGTQRDPDCVEVPNTRSKLVTDLRRRYNFFEVVSLDDSYQPARP
jgi:hypothetical protein